MVHYYYHPMSTNCRKTTALLDHLGIDSETAWSALTGRLEGCP